VGYLDRFPRDMVWVLGLGRQSDSYFFDREFFLEGFFWSFFSFFERREKKNFFENVFEGVHVLGMDWNRMQKWWKSVKTFLLFFFYSWKSFGSKQLKTNNNQLRTVTD